jgi:hypothetical protein
MATESIGTLIPTAIPGYTDSADIQAALRAYHYGSYSYDPANTSPGSLVTPSIAKTIYDIEQDIISLENRPSSGGEVNATEPVPGDFTPAAIPDGFIWVDSDGSTGNGPYSATSVFTNSAPTANLTTGVIWVDKDPTSITVNPFIPQTIIGAKGDIVVGTANDTASVLSAGTNGFVLSANSATTSGLEWIANDVGDITGVTAGVGISGGGTSGAVTITNDMATTITTNGDLIYGTGSGTYTRRAIGSSGQVLSVSGGVPTWATPSSSALTLVKARTNFNNVASTGTTFDNVFTSTYANYIIVLDYISAVNANDTLKFQWRSGGTTYSGGNYYSGYSNVTWNGTSAPVGNSGGTYVSVGTLAAGGNSANYTINYYSPQDTSANHKVAYHGYSPQLQGYVYGSGFVNTTNANYDGFIISCSTGNIYTGYVTVYGLVKA